MKLEFLMKVLDTTQKDSEDQQDLELKRLIEGEIEETYVYKPYVLDLRDVGSYGMIDDEHTKLVTPFGIFYARVDYNTFCAVYETALNTRIKTLNDFQFKNIK